MINLGLSDTTTFDSVRILRHIEKKMELPRCTVCGIVERELNLVREKAKHFDKLFEKQIKSEELRNVLLNEN